MRNAISQAVRRYALTQPQSPAFVGQEVTLCYANLPKIISDAGRLLGGCAAVAVALDNSPAWAVLNLAALENQIPVIALPFFFSAEQVVHALDDSGADCVWTDQPEYYQKLLTEAGVSLCPSTTFTVAGKTLSQLRLAQPKPQRLPAGTAKITYTSGTTGTPKGVCLSADAMLTVAQSLRQASAASKHDRHLCLLPPATLLENIGGIYTALLAGACCHLLPLQQIGIYGTNRLDWLKMLQALLATQASTMILTPELLQGLVMALESGNTQAADLRFVAVGGATVGQRLLQRAQQAGVPVFEGYGLSECASVVALNTPRAWRAGSVGKPLPHAQLSIADDGEILVGGALLLGYAGDTAMQQADGWPTGDIGYLDQDGYLFITGRKKNMFITSFGRNVAPEWMERELTLHPAIAQAAVFGEARPLNVAVIVARDNAQAVDQAIAETNQLLPDYARIGRWIPAQAPFSVANGQLTANGRLRREPIFAAYRNAINRFYEECCNAVL